jgi:hypothetical protein
MIGGGGADVEASSSLVAECLPELVKRRAAPGSGGVRATTLGMHSTQNPGVWRDLHVPRLHFGALHVGYHADAVVDHADRRESPIGNARQHI